MARSSYIYLVMKPGASKPAGVFTVKYEMVTWARRRYDNPKRADVKYYRMADGGNYPFESVPWTEMDVDKLFGEDS